MSGGAHVGSIDAVRDFRAALVVFAHEAREALLSFDMESRRSLDWLVETQPKFWRQEIRRYTDLLTQAKIELERCRNSRLPGGEAPSCMEERKTVERARARLQYAEEKFETTRGWAATAQREAIEYSGRANQLQSVFDAQFPAALSLLERVLSSLDAYTAVSSESFGATTATGATDAGAGAVSRPLDAVSEAERAVENASAPENPSLAPPPDEEHTP